MAWFLRSSRFTLVTTYRRKPERLAAWVEEEWHRVTKSSICISFSLITDRDSESVLRMDTVIHEKGPTQYLPSEFPRGCAMRKRAVATNENENPYTYDSDEVRPARTRDQWRYVHGGSLLERQSAVLFHIGPSIRTFVHHASRMVPPAKAVLFQLNGPMIRHTRPVISTICLLWTQTDTRVRTVQTPERKPWKLLFEAKNYSYACSHNESRVGIQTAQSETSV